MGRDRIKELDQIFDGIFTALQNDDFEKLDIFFKKLKDMNFEDIDDFYISDIIKKIEAVKIMIGKKQESIIDKISNKENVKRYDR